MRAGDPEFHLLAPGSGLMENSRDQSQGDTPLQALPTALEERADFGFWIRSWNL